MEWVRRDAAEQCVISSELHGKHVGNWRRVDVAVSPTFGRCQESVDEVAI